jgi:uncharacterized protein (DUF433 family)
MTTLTQSLPPHSESTLLRVDEEGTLRVGNSRITLDLIAQQYENGMSPEDMVRAYDTLSLADAYSAVTYYLRHRDEVLAYLLRRKEEAQSFQAKIEADRPSISREELVARRRGKEATNAQIGQ